MRILPYNNAAGDIISALMHVMSGSTRVYNKEAGRRRGGARDWSNIVTWFVNIGAGGPETPVPPPARSPRKQKEARS